MNSGNSLRGAFVVCALVASFHGDAEAVVLSDAPLWELRAGDPANPYLTTDNTHRGLAYNPVTGNVLVASRTTGQDGVYVLNGQTGAVIGKLNTTGIAGGTFPFNMLGIGDDGAIYTSNLTTNSVTTPFKIYRWESETAGLDTGDNLAPTVVYSGDPANGTGGGTPPRFGDSFAVIGSGANTRIIAGARNQVTPAVTPAQTQTALFTSTDPATAFTPSIVSTQHNSGTLGLAFEDGDTFWTKAPSSNLRQVNISGSAGTIAADVTGLTPTTTPLGVDAANHLLGLIKYASSTVPGTELRLYDISNPSAPVLLDTVAFPTDAVNGNGVGSVSFGDGVVYALATNNGIIAYEIVPEPTALGLLALAGMGALARRRRAMR